MIALAIPATLAIAILGLFEYLGGLPLATDPKGTRWVKRTVRRYRNSLNGKTYRHRIVYGSRFVRTMIRLKRFPATRLGWTPTPSGLLRDGLGHADLDTLAHEMFHGVQYEQMPEHWLPDAIQWPVYYFSNQEALEFGATGFASQVVQRRVTTVTLTNRKTLTLDTQIFLDGASERRAA